MTGEQWDSVATFSGMLDAIDPLVPGQISYRKMQLFGVSCCRAVWEHIQDSRCRAAVEVGERFADGLCDRHELAEAIKEAHYRRPDMEKQRPPWTSVAGTAALAEADLVEGAVVDFEDPADTQLRTLAIVNAEMTSAEAVNLCGLVCGPEPIVSKRVMNSQCELLRDILGNPFRPVAFSPAWRSSAALGLATTMYAGRDFAHMPVLADALEEAGCDHPDVLSHCRGPGPHVRGCWVVDLVLGKS
ncbi:MAG: hypothetical protein ACRC7O_07010 [Fimbriiglobus sp.]